MMHGVMINYISICDNMGIKRSVRTSAMQKLKEQDIGLKCQTPLRLKASVEEVEGFFSRLNM